MHNCLFLGHLDRDIVRAGMGCGGLGGGLEVLGQLQPRHGGHLVNLSVTCHETHQTSFTGIIKLGHENYSKITNVPVLGHMHSN